MTVLDDAVSLGAQGKVLEAAHEIQKNIDAGLQPPQELVAYLHTWVAKQRGQNKWGK